MSTGFATLSEINAACNVLIEEGVKDLCILKCTSEYPAPASKINLKTIPHLKEAFQCPVGLSDHTLGIAVPIASVGFDVSVIEKHFILDRKHNTADSFFSATPDELKMMVDSVAIAYEAIGEVSYPIKPMPAQRSLIVIKDILEGEVFIENINIKSLRPGEGINPSEISNVINRKAVKDIKKGSLLQWNLIGELNE
jgi:sialic acid synthase SpsE